MDPTSAQLALLEREADLAQAGRVLARAQGGRGGVLLVTGEAGIGKTSLVRRLAAAPSGRWRVMWGACEDLHSPRPLGPLRDIALRVRGALLQGLESGAPAADVFAAFHELIDISAVCSLIVFEDVHWADQATLDLIKYLGRRVTQLPVALVLSYRSEEVGSAHPLQVVLGDLPGEAVTTVSLAALSAQGVERLARDAGRPGDGLHAITGGNPFFITELLSSGVAGEGRGVPTSVRGAVLTRLARLDPAAREAIDALSVFPGDIEWWLARAMLPHLPAASIDACVQRGLLVADRDTLVFRHELARRATLDALPPARRMALHARALDVLSAPPAPARVALSRLTHHAVEAGDAAGVLELAPRAAREAAALGAHRQAAQQYATALRYARIAEPEVQAQLHEDWSYEAGLALGIDRQVIAARAHAVEQWRRLGRMDKVGHNLRWLSRL